MASSWSGSPEYAGFWPRAGACAIDWLIVYVVSAPLAAALQFRAEGLLGLLVLAAAVLVFWRRYGATPGKLAFGLRIVDAASGGAPARARLVARLLAYLVSALPLYLGFLWIAFDRRKQGWHDKIAGTIVITED